MGEEVEVRVPRGGVPLCARWYEGSSDGRPCKLAVSKEELRLKMIQRERDRERKRIKRMNREYRRLEQERDRDRKKARRANEAFRQLEKLRDKIRKDRKKGYLVTDPSQLPPEFAAILQPVPVVKPDVGLPPTSQGQQQQQQQPRSFAYPALPITSVTLMPQLCHPILHQNLSATLYAGPNGIKQEYGQDVSASAMAAAQAAALAALRGQQHTQDDQDMALNLEPEIILQTAPDVNPAQPQQHHLTDHQQQQQQQQQHCNIFQHMAPQAHMQHMRSAALPPPPPSVALLPPPPPATHQQVCL
ncbi:PAX-interacting protein 1 [Drosophila persimilis]|nr:PAX-interacting protein 1 [Drosophila persimilis]